MSLGEPQACNCAKSGSARMSLFVFFSYAFRATWKTDWKLGEGVDVDVDGARDIMKLE